MHDAATTIADESKDVLGIYFVFACVNKKNSVEPVKRWEVFAKNCKNACDLVDNKNIPAGTYLMAKLALE